MPDMKCRHLTVLSFGLANLLLSIGMLSAGVWIILRSRAISFGAGLWGGLWALITGIIGIIGGAMRRPLLEITFMLMSIFTASVIAVAVITSTIVSQVYEKQVLKLEI